MISLEEARACLIAATPQPSAEQVALADAPGRFAAEIPRARIDLPRFDNSAMDGYAVRAEDLAKADANTPRALRLAGRIGAGQEFSGMVEPGTCVRLFTGSKIPAGADAVVMQEDTVAEGETIRFSEPIKPFENIRLRGEDLRAGTALLEPGSRISSLHCGLMAAAGIGELLVYKRPALALLATGNELREPGAALGPGEIYESNRILLSTLLADMNLGATRLPIVPDDLGATERALGAALETHDLVISTGGVSVGEFDFVKEAFRRLGGQLDLWRVAIRPGKPFVFGRLGSKLLCGLPGNPVSALVTFLTLVRPALLKMQGAAALDLPRIQGELAEAVANRGDRRHFLRVRWEAGKVRVAGAQASHMLGALGQANGLLELAPGESLPAGRPVPVQLWRLPD